MSPRLYLVARPSLVPAEVKRFLEDESTAWRTSSEATEAESLVELTGRICYMSFGHRQSPKTNADYIAHLVRQGHESVLEHATWTFIIAGVSRAFTHQLVRHRAGFSFSQLSQQYSDQGEAGFVKPTVIAADAELSRMWDDAMVESRAAYRRLRDGLAGDSTATSGDRERQRAVRSAARSVMPTATETTIAVTANGRALRHFLAVRGAIVGDEEMRAVSAALLTILELEAPSLVADFELRRLDDGSPVVVATTE